MTPPDVLYIVRPGDHNPELRYSLRSIATNLPHHRVFIAGHTPPWVRDVTPIPTTQNADHYGNAWHNFTTGIQHPELGDEFYLFNDDFYAMWPGNPPPLAHRGTISQMFSRLHYNGDPKHDYLHRIKQAADWLRDEHGITDPLSFELHLPMHMHTDTALRIFNQASPIAAAGGKRTIYGNLAAHYWTTTLEQWDDVRPVTGDYWTWPWISTNDHSFRTGRVGTFLAHRFPTPGPYENPQGAPTTTTNLWLNTAQPDHGRGRIKTLASDDPHAQRLGPDWTLVQPLG